MERARDPGAPRQVLGVIAEPLNGVGYIRFAEPFRQIASAGYRLRTLGPSLTLEGDGTGYRLPADLLDGLSMVVFPQLVASPRLPDGGRLDLVSSICRHAETHGLRVVYSADDHLAAIDPGNPGYETVVESIRNLDTILEHADALIVTTPALQRTFSDHGKPIYLLPNAVEPSRWTLRPSASGELRVGWTGSSSHLDDLLMVVPAIRRLQKRVRCRFILQGLVGRPIDDEASEVRRIRGGLRGSQRKTAEAFLELASMLRTIEWHHVPFCSVEAFFDLLPRLDLDIGICPLLDTEFNRHKSANKFYEYAATGTMTVASSVEPYVDEVSVHVPNQEQAWSEVLESHLLDPERRDEALRRQRDFVLSSRTAEVIGPRWVEALDRILEPAVVGTPA